MSSNPKPKTYHLPPTRLIPNSPNPLLHYPSFFSSPSSSSLSLPKIHTHFTTNLWTPQWIFRYGPTQSSHYHSRTHECMVVLSGQARILFGVADAETNAPKTGESHEKEAGVEILAKKGDVFVLPAGVAHKTFDAEPSAPFALLTPGEGRGFTREEAGKVRIEEGEGFTMMGAYPLGAEGWDFMVGGEDVGGFERVWGVGRPEMDPVLGGGEEGLVGLWVRGKREKRRGMERL